MPTLPTSASYSIPSPRRAWLTVFSRVVDPFSFLQPGYLHFAFLLLLAAFLLCLPPSVISTPPPSRTSPAANGSTRPSRPRPSAPAREEFDFIVVGGGSSGSVVAARLAQANHSVLLLEAGGPTQHSLDGERLTVHPNLTLFDVPLYWTDITANPLYAAEYEWELYASPRPQIARGLGGCSVHNAMIYIRGLDRDFDDWGEEWSYEEVMPFYRRSVTQQDAQLRTSPLHAAERGASGGAVGGEVHLSSIHPQDRDPISSQFVASCRAAGEAEVRDFNGAHRREGAGYYQFLIREGLRDTPASALYGAKTALKTSGRLTIRTYAQAVRVVLDKPAVPSANVSGAGANDTKGSASRAPSSAFSLTSSLPRAIAVEYVTLPQSPLSSLTSSSHSLSSIPTRLAYAKHEIVLSAGAVGSPKLLLLSGIGTRADLEALGVDVVREMEGVGRNAMDGSKVIMQWDAPSVYFNPCIPAEDIGGRRMHEKDAEDERQQREYCTAAEQTFYAARAQLPQLHAEQPSQSQSQASHTLLPPLSYGIMGTPGFSAGAFLKSHSSLERPNVQLTIFPWDKIQREWKETLTGIVTLEVATNNPISRGRVGLRSAQWYDPPTVDVNYLSNPDDVEVLLWAIKRVREITVVGPLNTTLVRELVPGLGMTDEELRDYIRCGARDYRGGKEGKDCDVDQRVLGHLAGTVRMGDPYIDAYACVDAHLRVIGVDGLRVADASIMPVLPSGNTHATCMMIGERAADFLLQAVAGVERSRAAEEEEHDMGRVRSVDGGEGMWRAMGGWKVVAAAVLCAAPLTLAYYCYTLRRSEWEDIDDADDDGEEQKRDGEDNDVGGGREAEGEKDAAPPPVATPSQPLLSAR